MENPLIPRVRQRCSWFESNSSWFTRSTHAQCVELLHQRTHCPRGARRVVDAPCCCLVNLQLALPVAWLGNPVLRHMQLKPLSAQTTLKAHPLERRRCRAVPRMCLEVSLAHRTYWLCFCPTTYKDQDNVNLVKVNAPSRPWCTTHFGTRRRFGLLWGRCLSLDTNASGGFTFTWVQWTFRQLIMLSTYIHNLFLRLPLCLCLCVCLCAFWPTLFPGIGRHSSPTGWVPVYIYMRIYACISFRGSSEANVSCYCCSCTWRTQISLQTVGQSVCV